MGLASHILDFLFLCYVFYAWLIILESDLSFDIHAMRMKAFDASLDACGFSLFLFVALDVARKLW